MEQGRTPRSRRSARRLGAIGTMVWDSIMDRDVRTEPVEEWGGIAYALQALSAALPQGWVVCPIMKVGGDMAEEALRFLRDIPRVEIGRGVDVVPLANPKVELRYEDGIRQAERITGGIVSWSWEELEQILEGLDALYVNFITGFEMDLATARRLHEAFSGPLYADLHSLFLSRTVDGRRFPQELPGWGAWLRTFDVVQMNEQEFELLGRSWGDPWQLAADVVGPELKLIAVTLAERGAAYVAGPDFESDPETWAPSRSRLGVGGASWSGRVPADIGTSEGDPTGCGDVWGATFLGRLLAGDSLETAMGVANRMAARNLGHRGTRDLHLHLRGLLSS